MRPTLRFSAVVMLATALIACGPNSLSNGATYSPPPPLAIVALIDPSSGRAASQLHQLEDVVRSSATPGEALVVMFIQPSFGQAYVVRSGDSLSTIANTHGLTLTALETANPQLGPVSGRDWKLIHPGEQVMIPNGAAQPSAAVLVTRAPAGPQPPELIRLPRKPGNPTDYQRAQYERTVAADNATNADRIARWRAGAAASLQPWQSEVAADLEKAAGVQAPASPPPDESMLSSSMTAGLTTLRGLVGRRLLLLLGGADLGPTRLQSGSLAGVNLVIANVVDSQAADAWTSVAAVAGARSFKALDPSLTQLQLAQTVNQ